MATLVTLDEAKMAAHITHDTEDAALTLILDEAEKLVLDVVKNRVADADEWETEVDAWDGTTVPRDIKGAILHQFVSAERFRGGDDPKAEPVWTQGLAPRAWTIVRKYGDPSLA